MKTIIIEYNEKNKYAKQVLSGLIGAGIIHRKEVLKTKDMFLSDLSVALQEAKVMAADIAKNGTGKYKTLDDLLNEE
jgi:hypothetical protein